VVGFAEGTAPYRQLTPFMTGVVISQFRTRGPNGAEDQFVELTNVSPAPIDIHDWVLQGSSSVSNVGLTNSLDNNRGGILNPGCSFLATSVPTSSPRAPAYSGSVPGDIGVLARFNDTIGIALRTRPGQIVDQVGMSENTIFKAGTPLEPFGSLNTDRAYVRVSNTRNNQRDFQMRSPSAPRHLSMCNQGSLPPGAAPYSILSAVTGSSRIALRPGTSAGSASSNAMQ
jgi:hypothetical protein